jgi:hypothetical protein
VVSDTAAFVLVLIVNRSAITTALEIELANGCSVRLTGSIEPGLLRVATMAAGELTNLGRGDH